MAGRVKHLESPIVAVEDSVDIFHAGVIARPADVAEERSDQRPEVKGFRWNCGRSLCKKTSREEKEEKNTHHFHARRPTERQYTSSILFRTCDVLINLHTYLKVSQASFSVSRL